MTKIRAGALAVVSILALSTAAAIAVAAPSDLPDVNQHFKANGPLTASAPGITPKAIKIGFITSQTGIAASTFKDGGLAAQARVDLQNAQGGVNGRKIVLVTADDGQSGNKVAAQNLVENEGVFGLADMSAFTVQAAPYLQQQGIPVTGFAIDGPEWGQEPNSNMFTIAPPYYTSFNGSYNIYDTNARFLKSLGVKKLAGLAFGISQSSIQNIKGTLAAAKKLGIKPCYENYSVQFGQTSFPTEALAIQQNGCDGVIGAMVDASDVGLAASLAQSGVKAKQMYYTGYDQGVLDDANASAALNGAYFPAAPNFVSPDKGTKGMVAALKKYAPKLKGIPSFGVYGGYQSTDLLLKGLEAAGQNPTRQGYIDALRKVQGYTGDGLFQPPGLSFTGFGTTGMFPAKNCTDFVQLDNGKYKTVKKNLCGKLVNYTS